MHASVPLIVANQDCVVFLTAECSWCVVQHPVLGVFLDDSFDATSYARSVLTQSTAAASNRALEDGLGALDTELRAEVVTRHDQLLMQVKQWNFTFGSWLRFFPRCFLFGDRVIIRYVRSWTVSTVAALPKNLFRCSIDSEVSMDFCCENHCFVGSGPSGHGQAAGVNLCVCFRSEYGINTQNAVQHSSTTTWRNLHAP